MTTHKKLILLSSVLSLPLFVSCQKKDPVSEQKSVKSTYNPQSKAAETDKYNTKTIREVKEPAPENKDLLSSILSNNDIKKIVEKARLKEFRKLEKLLNLSPEQREKVESYLAQGEHSSSGRFDVFLKELLTPEQLKSFRENEIKKAEKQREVTALRKLADIHSVLDLSEEQQDSVLTLLYENSDTAESHNMGLSIKAGIAGANDTDNINMQPIIDEGVEQTHARNQELLDRLAPVLTEDQLQDYTDHLNERAEELQDTRVIVKSLFE